MKEKYDQQGVVARDGVERHRVVGLGGLGGGDGGLVGVCRPALVLCAKGRRGGASGRIGQSYKDSGIGGDGGIAAPCGRTERADAERA